MDNAPIPRIKICGVTSIHDAQLVVEGGADALGLIYANSVRQVSDDVAKEILEFCGKQLSVVGVFRHQDDEEVVRIVQRDALGTVQLHDPASDSLLQRLHARDVRVVRAVTVHSPALSPRELEQVVAVIVDSAQPGSGVTNDWLAVASMKFTVPMLIAGGLDPQNVRDVIGHTAPWGVDVASGVESAPGVKDHAKVASFVARAREALLQKGVS